MAKCKCGFTGTLEEVDDHLSYMTTYDDNKEHYMIQTHA
jgi:hypothetical protein